MIPRIRHILDNIDWDLLTDWEARFVDSVSLQFDRTASLTDKQIEKLEEIYLRVNSL